MEPPPAPDRPVPLSPLRSLLSRRIRLRYKMTFLILLIILALVAPVSLLILGKQSQQASHRLTSFGRALVDTYANYSAEFVLQGDWPSLDPFIREVGRLDEVRYVLIVDRSDVIKAHSDVKRMEQRYAPPGEAVEILAEPGLRVLRFHDRTLGEHILDFSRGISYQGREIGTLHLGISQARVERDYRTLRTFIIILTLLTLAIGLGASYVAGVVMSSPIAALVEGTKAIGAGNFEHRIAVSSQDELGDLARAFNQMAVELRQKRIIQQSFGCYVTPEIVDMILENPDQPWLGGARKLVTVLFADIRNFTAFTEEHDAEIVVGVLNEYFSFATELIIAQGGRVDKFVGDEVMGVFGAPVFDEQHALRAVTAAVRIREEMRRWSVNRQRESRSPIAVGIGLNTGWVVAGNLGSERHKREYTVIGDDVNLASRLSDLAAPDQILISERTYRLLGSAFSVRKLQPIQVKGKRHVVDIYEVLGFGNAP